MATAEDRAEPADEFDVARARRETAGLESGLFLDSAGASLMPRPVLATVIAHLELESQLGGYRAKEEREAQIEGVYDSIAQLIGCARGEIALLENATRAWDAAFYGLALGPGDRILTDVAAYGSNYLAFLQAARRTGAEILVVPDGADGQLDLAALEAAMDERTRLLAITWIPTGGGRVNPAAAAGAIARSHNVPYLLDACQAVGQVPVDVQALQCDFLSATGRKYLRGPRGTGFLYVRREFLERVEPPVIDVRSATWTTEASYRWRPDARRFETWEMNYAGLLGLGRAVDYAMSWNVERTWRRIEALAAGLRGRLNAIPGVRTHDTGRTRCGIVTFSVDGQAAPSIKERLAAERVTVSVSGPGGQRLDFERRGLREVVRASVHYFNTEAELDRFAGMIAAMAHGGR